MATSMSDPVGLRLAASAIPAEVQESDWRKRLPLIVSGTISGLTETATIYIFTALEERLEAQAHVVALVLATVSILLLVVIEWLHRRNERARSHA